MVLSDRDIRREMARGKIRFLPHISNAQIGAASVDLTLDGKFWKFRKKYARAKKAVDLSSVGFAEATEEIDAKSVVLQPGEMCLGITKERITLAPDIMGSLEGRSRYARMGLAVHITSALVQAGSDNHQVLEIVNLAPFPVIIHEGMRISQIVFERLESPTSKPYSKFGKIAKKQ
jgi:dCTP deaminase